MRQSIPGSVIAGLFFSLVFSAATIQAQTFSTLWMHSAQGDWATPWGALDPRILFYPPSWGQLTGATGNWDGMRSRLSDEGVSVFGSYESESGGNPVGGEDHKFRYTHNLALGIALDLGRLLGLSDTYLLASASQRTGNSLSNDILNFFQVQQIYGHQTIRFGGPGH
jgi:hypothetical protein